MLKKISYVAITATCLILNACNKSADNGNFKTTKNGLEYQILKDEKGDKAKIGDILVTHIRFGTPDSILFDSEKNGQPAFIQVTNPVFKGSIEEGFLELSAGDSAILRVNADSMYRYAFKSDVPAFAKKEGKVTFWLKVLEIKNEEREAKAFLENAGLKPQKTSTGLLYVVEKEGNGNLPKNGQTVKVHYTGTLLNGQKFDSSVDRNEPYAFPIGQGRVIPGWDEGLMLMGKGAKYKFIIPSYLAYGPRGNGPIPPYSTLLFDVEMIDITDK